MLKAIKNLRVFTHDVENPTWSWQFMLRFDSLVRALRRYHSQTIETLECDTGPQYDQGANIGNLRSLPCLRKVRIKQQHIIHHIPACSSCSSRNPYMESPAQMEYCDNTFPECLRCLRKGLTCLYPLPKRESFDETIAQKLPPSLEILHLLSCDLSCTWHLQTLAAACAEGSFPHLRQVYIEMRGFIPPSGRETFQVIFDMCNRMTSIS